MRLAEKHSVRFAKVMTCLTLAVWASAFGRACRCAKWSGLRSRRRIFAEFSTTVIIIAIPQMFRSSLPIGRVLEDLYDLPPVILCYKLNGKWLDSERGGPVRVVVPEAYGFKSVKWLTHVVLTNLSNANDTYAEQNNDVDSPLKTFAATLSTPAEVKQGEPIPSRATLSGRFRPVERPGMDSSGRPEMAH